MPIVEILTFLIGHIDRDIWYRTVSSSVCTGMLMAMLAIVQALRGKTGVSLTTDLTSTRYAKKKPGGTIHRALLLRPQPPGIRFS
ncbi:MAG: hypothetical protein CMJ74_02340 [Planctomycetaceae bacterium]|nr:hypothetical protein [Planctomycetaceae bacterium]|tara:strand:- start:283 stop:537 length:255 start_codon:yes stop_codon:yes gene_type:complete